MRMVVWGAPETVTGTETGSPTLRVSRSTVASPTGTGGESTNVESPAGVASPNDVVALPVGTAGPTTTLVNVQVSLLGFEALWKTPPADWQVCCRLWSASAGAAGSANKDALAAASTRVRCVMDPSHTSLG
jgi:hypothetical protein